MYQLGYLVYIVLTLYGQSMVAQDQLNTNNVGADSAPVALQTLQSNDEVRPLIVTSGEASEAVEHQDASHDHVLPRVPRENVTAQDVTSPAAPSPQVISVNAVDDAPNVPQPVKVEDMPEKIVEPKGIDTVDIKEPEGNWLFKRIWWEKSKEVYGKIRDRVDKIIESRMHFFKERVKLDREVIDPFYVEIGLDQGALQESVNFYLGLLQKDQEKDGELSPSAQEKILALQEEKAAVTKLGETVKTVQDLSQKLDDALERLMSQINLARSYEGEAWQRLDQIAEELNDKKAREHYYAIATLWRNVKDIGNYIQGPFAQHFIKLAQTSVQSVQNIKSIAGMLAQKGFALKERIELTAKEDEQADEDEDEYLLPKKELGWGAWVWKKITDWFVG
jgi:uncharacterized protein YoxC